MSDYGVTDKGFQMRRLDEIYTDICKRFKDEVGVDPSENPQSVMNILFTIFADAPAELWEAYAAAYQQLFPNTACGVALDNVMQVGGVSRIGQAKTKYFISCTGQEGTVIPVGALIQSSSRPQRTFQAVSASIISSANWRKLAIRPIESIAGTFTFDFGVSRNATSGEVGTYAESSSVTKKMTVSSYDDAYSQMLAAVKSFDALVMKSVSDYIISKQLDVSITMLDDILGGKAMNNNNFCGGTGAMMSFAPDGSAYPCIRYAPISIGKEKSEKVRFGSVYDGLYVMDAQRQAKAELDAITLTSQSSKECLECPVSAGCGWCSGLNYEMYGTANKRFTGICWAHKARVLASAYYHNRRYIEIGDCLPIKAELPKDDALEILPAADYEEFLKIERATLLKFADENGIG